MRLKSQRNTISLFLSLFLLVTIITPVRAGEQRYYVPSVDPQYQSVLKDEDNVIVSTGNVL
ncbi:MAG: hypothetical protein J7M40_03485 [Planctomycetes bacterium]|nr:hypothetical protein [Planctomycetota bacterium]